MTHVIPHVWNRYVRNNEPLYITPELSVMFNSESDWRFLDTEMYDLMDDGKIRIDGWTARIHAEHWDDERRFWVNFSIWNGDDLVISGRHAGREGDDHVEHFYHDDGGYSKLIGELYLILIRYEESKTKKDADKDADRDALNINPYKLYGKDLSLHNESPFPNRRYWADDEEPKTNVISFVDEVARLKEKDENGLRKSIKSLMEESDRMTAELRSMMQDHAFAFRNCYGSKVPKLPRYTLSSLHENWEITLVSHHNENVRPTKLHLELMASGERQVRTILDDQLFGMPIKEMDTVICFFYAHPYKDVVHVCSLYFNDADPSEFYTFVGDNALFDVLMESLTLTQLHTIDSTYENESPTIDM